MTQTAKIVAAVLVTFVWGATAECATLMLDFGGSTTTGSGQGAVGPGHFEGLLTAADDVWNPIGTSDTSSLVFSNGSPATGVSLDLGGETGTTTDVIGWSETRFATRNPGDGGLLDYQKNNVVRDYTRTNYSSTVAMGYRVTGLSPGLYYVYAAADDTYHLPGAGNNTSFEVFLGTQTGGADTDYSGFISDVLENVDASGSYVRGDNYSRTLVKLGAGESLVIASERRGPSDGRGQMNALQIMPIPEPAALAIWSLLGVLAAAAGWRRRRP